jgi:hypothetical protein
VPLRKPKVERSVNNKYMGRCVFEHKRTQTKYVYPIALYKTRLQQSKQVQECIAEPSGLYVTFWKYYWNPDMV